MVSFIDRKAASEDTNLCRVEFTLLEAKLPSPGSLSLRHRLDARLELIDLSPTMIKLFLDLLQPLAILVLRLFDAPVKIKLDLAERFEPCDQVIMEDAKVGEWLCLSLTALLLEDTEVRLYGAMGTQMPRTGVLSTPRILSMYW